MSVLPSQQRPERSVSDVDVLSRLAPDDPRRAALRSRIVEAHLPLVGHLAARYRDHGEPIEDLVQIGTIGLINAVDRFDADRGVALASYATPIILGEIRRHFRDCASAVRLPRRLTELQAHMAQARAELTQGLGRSPTVAELSARLNETEETVLDVLEGGRARMTRPLTGLDEDAGPGGDLHPHLGGVDEAFAGVDDRETLRPLLSRLPSREKQILALRFLRGLSQAEIADELGISQVHVSRLLARTVQQLSRSLVETS